MNTFEEYQRTATATRPSLRNNRDRIDMPVMGLQHEAGKVGSILQAAFTSGKLNLTAQQAEQLKGHLADILWCVAIVCDETGIPLQEVAAHSLQQLALRAKTFDAEQR